MVSILHRYGIACFCILVLILVFEPIVISGDKPDNSSVTNKPEQSNIEEIDRKMKELGISGSSSRQDDGNRGQDKLKLLCKITITPLVNVGVMPRTHELIAEIDFIRNTVNGHDAEINENYIR